MKSKRILLVIPEMTMGGAQRSLAKLSVELAKSHRVWIAVFNSTVIAYPFGGDLLTLGVPLRAGILGKTFSFLQRIKRLTKLKRQLRITIAISFLEGADYINILSKRSEKIIISVRGSKRNDETMLGKFEFMRKRILIPILYRMADKLIAVNKGIEGELIHNFKMPKKIVATIYNFYNNQEILEQAAEVKDSLLLAYYRHPIIVASGRLAPEKGLTALVKIYARIKARKSDVKLLLLGDGPEYNKLYNLCSEVGLVASESVSDQPEILFLRNESNIFKYLHGATSYLMNSSSEGFPNGLAEAMICGLPVVSADCPYGPREIMTSSVSAINNLSSPEFTTVGVLMPRANEDNFEIIDLWAHTILRLLNNDHLRISFAKAAQIRMNDFSKDKILEQWHRVINE